MNQPPDSQQLSPNPAPSNSTRPAWLRPRGVAAGTWEYVNQRSIADRYDAFVADTPLCQQDSQILTQLFPPIENTGDQQLQTILDLGCGSGRNAIPLAKRGYRVLGVDLSERMLEVMMDKTADVNGRIVPLRANLVELDCLVNHSVDHAVCLFSTLGMIQGRHNRNAVLKHAARIVRNGGSLVVHVHNRWAALREPAGLSYLLRTWWQSVCKRDCDFGDATYHYRGVESMFMHRFSRNELLHDLVDAGWNVQKVWQVSIDGTSSNETGIPGGYIVHCLQG